MVRLALPFLLTASISAQQQEPPVPQKPFFYRYVEWTYLDAESKIKRKAKDVEVTDTGLRLIDYRDKSKPDNTVEISYAAITAIEFAGAKSGTSIHLGFGITTTDKDHWLKITAGDTYYLLKLRDTRGPEWRVFLSELERRSKIAVGAGGG